MTKYSLYTTSQLYEHILSNEGPTRTYLIRLLVKKDKSKKFISSLLKQQDDQLTLEVVRLLSPEEINPIRPLMIGLLRSASLKIRKLVAAKLGSVRAPDITAALLQIVGDKSEDRQLKKIAITALGDSGEESAVDSLINLFPSFDDDTKIVILNNFLKWKSKKVISLVRILLHDIDPSIRFWALKLAKQFPGEFQYQEFIRFIEEEHEEQNISLAITILGFFTNASVLDFLVRLIASDKVKGVRYELLHALANFEPEMVKNRLANEQRIVKDKTAARNLQDALVSLSDSLAMRAGSDKSIFKTWTRDPLSYPDTSTLSFLANGEAIYEEQKAGELLLSVRFKFKLENNSIVFDFGSNGTQEAAYEINDEVFIHPYEGQISCYVLRFDRSDISMENVNISAGHYYHFKTDYQT